MRSASALLLSVVLVAFLGVGVSGGGAVMAQQKASAPEKEFEDFDRNNFDRSTTIDNPWFPMKPGMRWVLKGFTNESGKRVPHRLVIIVTDLTKMIDGVRSVVLWMEDYSAGQLMERELAFFAQDKEGNVRESWRKLLPGSTASRDRERGSPCRQRPGSERPASPRGGRPR